MAGQFEAIGQQFVQAYYQLFDSDRSQLHVLYGDTSMLTFEGEQIQGAQPITQKIASLPFTKVQHHVVKADYQPSPTANGILIFVTGHLIVDDNQNPLKFAQVFMLCQGGANGWFIQNDMFRLNIG